MFSLALKNSVKHVIGEKFEESFQLSFQIIRTKFGNFSSGFDCISSLEMKLNNLYYIFFLNTYIILINTRIKTQPFFTQ